MRQCGADLPSQRRVTDATNAPARARGPRKPRARQQLQEDGMLTYPDIEPIAFQLGPIAIHWYGLMYGIGFVGAWLLGRHYARRSWSPLKPSDMDDLVLYLALGVVLGGRMGYMLFYQTPALLEAPWVVFRIWEGGMSFHGGFLGVLAAAALFAYRRGIGYLSLTDFIAPLVPVGLATGRLGNFINGELWGRPTDLPWGMVYPPLGPEPRHPSMLYEMLLEGVVLFILLNWVARRPRPLGALSGLFLIGYGSFRFLVEFVRLPDAHIGYLAWGWVTMGQVLSLPMIVLGLALLAYAYGSAGRLEASAGRREESA
jgi:phosphatidylglycerol:prolipoprotein diacylglycerol transferase